MTSSDDSENMRAHCAKCGGERNCAIKGRHYEHFKERHVDWGVTWLILACCGCDYVFAQTMSWHSENVDYDVDEDGQQTMSQIYAISTWPARSRRELPNWFAQQTLPPVVENAQVLNETLSELYAALNADLRALSSIAIRTVLDVASEHLGAEPSHDFKQKLNDMVDMGRLLDTDKAQLEILVDSGNASAHRGWVPTSDDLNALMTTLERFIYDAVVYPAEQKAHKEKLASIGAKVPPRPRAPRALKRARSEKNATHGVVE